MEHQLMIHIGNQLKLPLKINTKKAAGEINSTSINIHQYMRLIYSPNKILLHLRKKKNFIYTVRDSLLVYPNLFTIPYRTLPFSVTIIITLAVSRREV